MSKDLACRQKKSHQTFVLAPLHVNRQAGGVRAPLVREAFGLTTCGPRTVPGRNDRGPSAVKLYALTPTRYIRRCLYIADLSILNPTLVSA